MVGDEPQVSPAPTGPRVFLCYRRDDSSGYAGHLYMDLVDRFGQPNVFMDIDSLDPGVDFLEAIDHTLARCDTVLVLIGRGWLTATGPDGERRLDNPDDFVRLEIEAALSAKHRVIPVLVAGAGMPSSRQMPMSLSGLARRHAVDLSDRRWRTDTEDLIHAIERQWSKSAQLPSTTGEGVAEVDEVEARHAWDPEGLAADALAEIVRVFGPQALTDERTLANRLSDLLIGDKVPRERSLLLAASRHRVVTDLQEHMGQGIGFDGAVRLTAQRLEQREALDSTGCAWVTDAFARALGYTRAIGYGSNPTTADNSPSVPHASPLPVTEIVPVPVVHSVETPERTGVTKSARAPDLRKVPDSPTVSSDFPDSVSFPKTYASKDPRIDILSRPFAVWRKRAFASIIDLIILGLPITIVDIIIWSSELQHRNANGRLVTTPLGVGIVVAEIVVFITYFAILDGNHRGQTIGKAINGLAVRRIEDGAPLGIGHAFLRRIVFVALFVFGFYVLGVVDALSPLWDTRRQAWHDKVVRSVVIVVQQSQSAIRNKP